MYWTRKKPMSEFWFHSFSMNNLRNSTRDIFWKCFEDLKVWHSNHLSKDARYTIRYRKKSGIVTWKWRPWQLLLQIDFFLIGCLNISNFSPSGPNPGRREKIKLKFYFHTSLWCLKRFYEDLKCHTQYHA